MKYVKLCLGFILAMAVFSAQAVVLKAGKNYVELKHPQPTDLKKIEVKEFFGYFCPACSHLEPVIERWDKRKPKDVILTHDHVRFAEALDTQQRIYYTLDVMGLVDKLQRKVFNAVHKDGKHLRSPNEAYKLMAKLGVNEAKFKQIFNSFSVISKAKGMRAVQANYEVNATPILIIAGKYKTSPAMAKGYEASLQVVDALINKVREERNQK